MPKKKSTKKKATKKKATKRRRKSNPGLGLDIKANGKTLSSSKPCPLWTVWMKTPKGRIPVGQVTAKTKAEAKRKAAAYIRKKFK